MHHKVGSRLPTSDNTIGWLSFELHLRPKASFIETTANQSTYFTHTINFAANEMMNGVRKELLRRTFTSNTSLIEAAVQSLERTFFSSVLNKHLELKGVKALGLYKQRSRQHEWYHERLWQDAPPLLTSTGKPVLPSEERCPTHSSLATAHHEHLT